MPLGCGICTLQSKPLLGNLHIDLTHYEYWSLASERHICVSVLKGLRVERASSTRLDEIYYFTRAELAWPFYILQ